MSTATRSIAVLTYLLGPLGWLYGLLARRDDALIVYHARQSLVINMIALAAPILWAVFGWLLSWIPAIGPILAVLLFGLVIAIEIGMIIALMYGVMHAQRGAIQMAPLVGSLAEKLPIAPIAVASVPENKAT